MQYGKTPAFAVRYHGANAPLAEMSSVAFNSMNVCLEVFLGPFDSLEQDQELRITVPHTKSKQEIMRSIDASFDDLFRGIDVIPIQFINERKSWQGSTLTFAISAKMGLLSAPLKGTIEVTERDLTIDLDLGLLGRLIPATRAREAISIPDSRTVDVRMNPTLHKLVCSNPLVVGYCK